MSNIILIGMPGVGKTTVGKALAKKLGYNFIDTDDLVKERILCSTIKDHIEKWGSHNFMQLEEEVVCSLGTYNNAVVATGGSVCYSAVAMKRLLKLGSLVLLDAPPSILKGRLGNLKERGIIMPNGEKTLEELYIERDQLYTHWCDYIVPTTDPVLETVNNILFALGFPINEEKPPIEVPESLAGNCPACESCDTMIFCGTCEEALIGGDGGYDMFKTSIKEAKEEVFEQIRLIIPECPGEWLHGSGGHKFYDGKCNKLMVWWDGEGEGHCDEHVPEKWKNNGYFETPWAEWIRGLSK